MAASEQKSLTFSNNPQKLYYGRKGPYRIFGDDVDEREAFSEAKAMERFDSVWRGRLGAAVEAADVIPADVASEKLPGQARAFFDRQAEHREFRLDGSTFIAQLKGNNVNQLWFVPSTTGDPRMLYVRFESVDDKERFERAARVAKRAPESLALKLLADFTNTLFDDR